VKFWNKISNVGYCDTLDAYEIRRVRLLARLNFMAVLVLFFYVIAELFLNIYSFLAPIGIMILLVVIDLLLLKFQKIATAKHFAIITISLSIGFFTLTTGDNYSEALFIPLMAMPLIIFKNKKTSFFYIFYILVLIVSVKFLQQYTQAWVELSSKEQVFFKTVNTLSAAFVTYLVTFYFKSENENFENKIIKMHDTVAEKNKEITDSIRYAKRIQQTLLPNEKLIEKWLNKLKK